MCNTIVIFQSQPPSPSSSISSNSSQPTEVRVECDESQEYAESESDGNGSPVNMSFGERLHEQEEETPVQAFHREFLDITVANAIPRKAAQNLLTVYLKYRESLPADFSLQYQTLKRQAFKKQPTPFMDVYVRDLFNQELIKKRGLKEYPTAMYTNRQRYRPVLVRTYFRIKDVLNVAKELHMPLENSPEFDCARIVLSYDGVPESKTSGVNSSLSIVCLRFHGCRTIYPIVLIKVTDKTYKSTASEVFQPVISEVNQLGLTVECLVADAPARAFARCQKTHAGFLSCDLCLAHGSKLVKGRVPSEGNPENITTGLYFPHRKNSPPCPLRTMGGVHAIMRNLEELLRAGTENARYSLCGYTGRSPFLDLPEFDIIEAIGVDYMHLIPLGVIKKLLFLCTTQRRSFPARLTSVKKYVEQWLEKQKVPRSFPRRARVDFAHYKASEWRAFGVLFFVIIVEALHAHELRALRQLWLLTAFLTRAHLLDDLDLAELDSKLQEEGTSLVAIGRVFLTTFHETFGNKQISYNVHIFGEHLNKIRQRGPLQDSSAFAFEDAYGTILRCFKVGTTSIGKQALTNMLFLAGRSKGHYCQKTVSFAPGNTTSRIRDDFIQAVDGHFYQLGLKRRENHFEARRITLQEYRPPRCPSVIPSFGLVNVHTFTGLSTDEPVILDISKSVKTKAVLVEMEKLTVIATVPLALLADC